MDVNDYVENIEDIEETDYIAYERTYNKFIARIDELEKKILDLSMDYKDSQRSNSIGVQNVYDKFIQIEIRQKQLEELLKSERVKEIVKSIPSEDDINRILSNIEKTQIGKLNKHLRGIKNELEELSSVFNY